MFNKVATTTLYLLLFLIFIGGVVRGTGAGMGCPDWPRCFGSWVPPTSIDQLPANYQEIYGAKLKGEVLFNATKTWIEYLNRLLGAVVGLFVVFTFGASFFNKFNKKLVTLLAGVVVILTGFQGWLGSKVVSSELSENMVTWHMFVALLILVLQVACLYFASNNTVYFKDFTGNYSSKRWVLVGLILVFTQIILGSQVRENVDVVSKVLGESQRENWIDQLGIIFKIHRSFSILLFIVTLYLFAEYKNDVNSRMRKMAHYIVLVVIAEMFVGVVLNYLGLPAIAQPFHLGLGVLLFYFYIVIYFNCRFTIQS